MAEHHPRSDIVFIAERHNIAYNKCDLNIDTFNVSLYYALNTMIHKLLLKEFLNGRS